MKVPSGSVARRRFSTFCFLPRRKRAYFERPDRQLSTSKASDSAFTALVPTPFSPTENWKTSSLYLPPVCIFDTQSTTLPKGMPRP